MYVHTKEDSLTFIPAHFHSHTYHSFLRLDPAASSEGHTHTVTDAICGCTDESELDRGLSVI